MDVANYYSALVSWELTSYVAGGGSGSASNLSKWWEISNTYVCNLSVCRVFFFWGWGRGGVWLNYYSRYAFNLSKRKQINVQPNKFMLRLPFLPFFNNFWLGISFSFLSTFWFHLFWQAKPNDIWQRGEAERWMISCSFPELDILDVLLGCWSLGDCSFLPHYSV